MEPAALPPGGGKDLLEGGPEARGAVADGQQGSSLQAVLLEVKQQLLPRCLGFAQPVADRHALLAPVGCHAEDHEQALAVRGFLGPPPRVDAIDPPVDVAGGREIAFIPAGVLLGPLSLETAHHIGREALASSPTRTFSASLMSPVEIPFKYSQGRAAEMRTVTGQG